MALFLAVSIGGGWLVALPLWISGEGWQSPLLPLVGTAMMVTPTLGVLAVWLRHRVPAREWTRRTGLIMGADPRRTVRATIGAWLGIPVLAAVAIALSGAVGVLTLDLGGLSLLRDQFATVGAELPLPPGALIAVTLLGTLLGGLVNAIPAFGEEWGWRGFLLPRLTALGTWRALVLSGVIWGIWHAPMTLLGYNYPKLGPYGAAMFVGFCVLFGCLLGWLRLRTGTIWPAVFGHGALNASAGLVTLAGDAAHPPNLAVAGITGLVGWLLLALLLLALPRFLPLPTVQRATYDGNLSASRIDRYGDSNADER